MRKFNFLNNLDILSSRPHLTIKEESRFYTNFGTFVVFGGILLSFIIFCISLKDLVSRSKISLFYNLESKIQPVIQMNNNLLGLIITDTLGNEIKDFSRVLNLEVKLYEYSFTRPEDKFGNITDDKATAIITNIPTIRCKNVENPEKTFELLNNIYDSALCLNFNSKNITLYGRYGSLEGFSSLNIYINKCVNSTSTNKTNCLPQIDIDKILFQNVLSLISLEYDVDSQNFLSPSQIYAKMDQMQISSTIYRKFFKDYNKIIIKSDNGLFIEDYLIDESYRSENIYETIDLAGNKSILSGAFNQIIFRCSGKTEVFKRTYMKFPTAFVNVSGFLQIILILSKLLVYNWSKNSMVNYLIMKMFDVEENMNLIYENKNLENLTVIKNNLESLKSFNKLKELLNLNENKLNNSKQNFLKNNVNLSKLENDIDINNKINFFKKKINYQKKIL